MLLSVGSGRFLGTSSYKTFFRMISHFRAQDRPGRGLLVSLIPFNAGKYFLCEKKKKSSNMLTVHDVQVQHLRKAYKPQRMFALDIFVFLC